MSGYDDTEILDDDVRQPAGPGPGIESIYEDVDESFDPEEVVTALSRENDADKYVIDEKIAEGGMGEVYRVYDQDLQRTSVIKVIRPEVGQNRQMFINFIEEARITGRLEHPNIIPVHGVGAIEGGKLYFSMKEIEGQSLDQIVQDLRSGVNKTHTVFSLLQIFRKVCDAIAFAHSKNIIHRDIKPENIMVGNYGEVLVVDWGLARDLNAKEEPTYTSTETGKIDLLHDTLVGRQLTQYGDIKGSPVYMSPEQALGLADEIDKRTDIFLLGSTLYGLATLSAPFEGQDLREIVFKAEKCDYVPPAERAPDRNLSPELCRIICKAMAADPKDRYQTANELIEDVDDLLEGQTASEQRVFRSGELLMEEGERGDQAYVITSGAVEVFKTVHGKVVPLIQLQDGDCIGEMALIANAPRSASVRALQETHVVVITSDLIRQGLDKLPAWMGQVIEALVERLQATNANVHQLVNSNCAYHVLKQLQMIYLCWGKPYQLEDRTVIVIESEHCIREIITNIGIAQDRVTRVIAAAVEYGLLHAYEESLISIPNLHVYGQFINYLMEEYKIDSTLPAPDGITLLSSDEAFVIRHALTDTFDDSMALELVPQEAAEYALGCQKEEVGERLGYLAEIIEEISAPPPPSEDE